MQKRTEGYPIRVLSQMGHILRPLLICFALVPCAAQYCLAKASSASACFCPIGKTTASAANGKPICAHCSDPAPQQQLSTTENAVLLDLFNAIIIGSPAQAAFHSDWLIDSSTTNPCGYSNMCYQFVDVGIGPISPALRGWCAVSGGTKVLDSIDLDLIPTTGTHDFGSYLSDPLAAVKDPGQIEFLDEKTYCHGRNWYAMIKAQMIAPNFDLNWGPKAASRLGGSTNPDFPLTACSMSYNPAGIVPSSLGRLTGLTSLRLRMLGIAQQPLPSWIGGMRALTLLDLSFNSFTGTLPSQLWSLTNLVELHLNDNLLTGPISPLLGQLSNLVILEIGYHPYETHAYEAYGPLPGAGSNRLTGSIPTQICLLTNLRQLQLNCNALSGPLPSCISQMTALRLLDIRFNQLTGSLPQFYTPPPINPSAVGNYWKIFFLLLDHNKFRGRLDSLGYLATGVHAGFCDGFGKTPIMGVVSTASDSLDWISIRDNQFSGPIPQFLSSMRFGRLDLSNNKLTGSIPDFLKQSVVYATLNLSGNKLSGQIPNGIFDYKLAWDVSNNLLTGTVPLIMYPPTAMRSMSLGKNKITQDLRSLMDNLFSKSGGYVWYGLSPYLVAFETLDISNNHISGKLESIESYLNPQFLFGKTYTPTVVNFLLGGNSISGQIPSAIAKLTNLLTLDLSDNLLSGTIPTGTFPRES